MSERPTSDLKKPELKDLVLAVKDVVKWHDLGLQLGFPEPTLASIALHPDIEGHLRMMLSDWLQFDPEASWEKLATTLNIIGKNAIAARVRREFVGVYTQLEKPASSQLSPIAATEKASEVEEEGSTNKEARNVTNAQVEQDENKRQAMAETAFRKIKSNFSILVSDVQSSMEDHKVKVKRVRRFLLEFCDGNCSIPKEDDLDTIFDTITEARLWRYDHYGLLEELAEKFLPEDDPVRAQVSEYKSQLTGFYATTRIIDFVKLNELEDCEDIPNRVFSPKKYNSHYQTLTVNLRLKRDVSELTLEYVDQLWKALMKEFHLPSLTAVMDKIVEGSLRITWLILPHIVDKIKATYFKLIEFFQQHNIIWIHLYSYYGYILYNEEMMVIGSTPLFRASFTGNIDEVKSLLEGGANVNETNDNKRAFTPLVGACINDHADIAKLLLEHKAYVDYQDKAGLSPLGWASGNGHTKTVMVLLEYGPQVDLSKRTGWNPLIEACAYGFAAVVRELLEHGANVDHCDEDGESALMYASGTGSKETVAVLLEYRAQVNLVDMYGRTALVWAVLAGYADTARLLLENGVTMDFEGKVWLSCLFNATDQGFSEVVELMLEYGTPMTGTVTKKEGNTVLGVACERGHAETARVLLSHGATLFLDYQNKSAIHLVCIGGHTETLKVLIEKAPQLNLQDQDGWTPLHFAVKQRHLEIVKLLLEHGAAINIESKIGLTALKVAQSEGHRDVCGILLQYTQQGPKVIYPESESRQREKTKAELAEMQRKSDTSANIKIQQQGEGDDSQRIPEDSQQKRRESEGQKEGETKNKQQDTTSELTEAQNAEVRSVGEWMRDQLWKQLKRIFLREVAAKEEAAEIRGERETSKHIIAPTKESGSIFSFLPWKSHRTPIH